MQAFVHDRVTTTCKKKTFIISFKQFASEFIKNLGRYVDNNNKSIYRTLSYVTQSALI